jgi:hypothetical protein
MVIETPYDDVYDAIVEYVGDGTPEKPGVWDHALAPIVLENQGDGAPAGDVAAWVEMVVDTSLYAQESIGGGADDEAGGNRWDEDGTLWFHVFIARGIGSREARRIAKGLANMFRGKTLLEGELEFGDADMGAGDPGQENGNYYLVSVSITWRRTEAQ